MKKVFLIFFMFLSMPYIQSYIEDLQKKLDSIRSLALYNSLVDSPNYYNRIFTQIHDACQEAHPGCCKADRITPFGVSIFVGTGFVLGLTASHLCAILAKTLDKTHP